MKRGLMSDNTQVDDTARRVAARLATDLDPALQDQVEQELARDPLEQPAERLIDPIFIGADCQHRFARLDYLRRAQK
jgi:hypothetical protein